MSPLPQTGTWKSRMGLSLIDVVVATELRRKLQSKGETCYARKLRLSARSRL